MADFAFNPTYTTGAFNFGGAPAGGPQPAAKLDTRDPWLFGPPPATSPMMGAISGMQQPRSWQSSLGSSPFGIYNPPAPVQPSVAQPTATDQVTDQERNPFAAQSVRGPTLDIFGNNKPFSGFSPPRSSYNPSYPSLYNAASSAMGNYSTYGAAPYVGANGSTYSGLGLGQGSALPSTFPQGTSASERLASPNATLREAYQQQYTGNAFSPQNQTSLNTGMQAPDITANVGMGGALGSMRSGFGAVTGYTNPNFEGSLAQQRMMAIGHQSDLERMRAAGASIRDRLAAEQLQRYYNFVVGSNKAQAQRLADLGTRQTQLFGESGKGFARQAAAYNQAATDWSRKAAGTFFGTPSTFGTPQAAQAPQAAAYGPKTPTWSALMNAPLGAGFSEKDRAKMLYALNPEAEPLYASATRKPVKAEPNSYQPTAEELAYASRRDRENAAALAKEEAKRKKTKPTYPLREGIRRDVYKEFGIPYKA